MSCHLVLSSLKNQMVCESLSKGTSCEWKRHHPQYIIPIVSCIVDWLFFIRSCFSLLVCQKFKKSSS